MKWYWRVLSYAAAIGIGFVAGWFVNWWNSPLARPMCLDTGGEYVALLVRDLPYWTGWAVIFGVAGVAACVPLWGIWAELRKAREANAKNPA
jgi:hypothetical protein